MALPINIEDLLNKRKIEGNRIEFKKGVGRYGSREQSKIDWYAEM